MGNGGGGGGAGQDIAQLTGAPGTHPLAISLMHPFVKSINVAANANRFSIMPSINCVGEGRGGGFSLHQLLFFFLVRFLHFVQLLSFRFSSLHALCFVVVAVAVAALLCSLILQ